MELVIDTIAARRGARTVLSGVSARVAAGEALVVTGPNGAGKSTLMRVIAGFLPPSAGEIRLETADGPLGGRDALQPRLAYAGHLDAVKPALGVAENLALWAALAGRDGAARESAVAAALDRFALGPLAARPAGECSAGQRRRLGLARLVLAERAVWLMDEPTASLDTASAAAVSALVDAHCAAGGIAVIATHLDLGLARARALTLAPTAGAPVPAPGDDRDPFLEGGW